jgi:copper resistance protein B
MKLPTILVAVVAWSLPLAAAAQEKDHSQMDRAQDPHQLEHVLGAANQGHDTPADALREPRAPIPLPTDAERQAAIPASTVHIAGDNAIHSFTLLNRLEGWDADQGTGLAWEGQGWIGQDVNRLWWRTEGEHVDGETEAANVEAFYGHAFSPWWDWVVGARQDFKPGNDRTFASLGVRGLAPQRFELSLTGYVGTGGQTALRFETEYELLFTNRAILQPLLDVFLHGKNDAARGIGSGLATTEAGLRLRYEFTRRFAPYVGVAYERAFGKTADLRRTASKDVDSIRVLAGVRIWF